MFRLPVVNASGMSPSEISDKLIENIKTSDIQNAIVGQIVENVSRENWGLVDMARVKREAASALHYDVTVKLENTSAKGSHSQYSTAGEARNIIKDEIAKLDTSKQLQSKTLELAISLFEEELAKVDLEKDSAKVSGKAAKTS